MGNTPTEIKNRIMNRLTSAASKMEGSFTADNVQALANELGRMYSEDYDRLIERSHIRTADGEDLDIAAKENHGMTRNEASREQVNLLFTGTEGTTVDETVGAYVDDIIFMVSGSYVIGSDGTVLATAVCTVPGSGYQVVENTVTKLLKNYDGIFSVTNPEASSGGYDRESDEEFRRRILEKEEDTPGYGNISWYRITAKEISGVEKAKVFDCARGFGTVDVVIIAVGNLPASDVLVQRVKDHIEDMRIAGVDLVVESGVPLPTTVSATVWLNAGVSIASVTEEFKSKLTEYFDSIEFDSEKVKSRISHAKISELLLNCDGVIDIDQVMLNGNAASIELESRYFPSMEEPVLSLGG